MNLTITENDRKLLGFLAAFLIAAAFFFLIFKPLHAKNEQMDAEIEIAREQEAEMDAKAAQSGDMVATEEATTEQMKLVLARFYPMLQSQEAERMVTVLMLNHNLSIQSLTVSMPEKSADLEWYQYSARAASQQAEGEETQEEALSLYAARITCVAEGSKEDLWNLIDDISSGYPAISIVSTEWSSTEKIVENNAANTAAEQAQTENQSEEETEEGSEAEEPVVQTVPVTEKADRLTIGLEIYMCNQ